MNIDQLDDDLDDLRMALDIEPAPEFAARVNAQIEGQAERSWTWTRAAVVGAGLLVATGIVGVRMRPEAPAADRQPAVVRTRSVETPASARPASRIAADARDRAAKRAGSSTAPRRAKAPEVLVPPDQLAALRQFAAGLRDGRLHADNLPASLIVPEDPPTEGSAPDSDVIRKIARTSTNADDLLP